MISESQIIFRLALAAILSGLVGLERETKHKPAGLRTNILVGIGSTLVTLVSVMSAELSSVDPTRIAAGIVTGIGFLGAGLMIRDQSGVHGITTATAVWMVAAIGLAVGFGYYFAAVAATLITLATLILSRDDKVTRWFGGRRGGGEV